MSENCVLLWIFQGINLGKIPRKFSDIFMEKFRHILGKIPMNFSMLTPQIFCFTEDGSSEELTLKNVLGVFYSNEFFLGSFLSRPSYLRRGKRHLCSISLTPIPWKNHFSFYDSEVSKLSMSGKTYWSKKPDLTLYC
jgi:hypothetical protein